MSPPIVRPIAREDVNAVVALLRSAHWSDLPEERARSIVLHDWEVDRPNYGYLLEANGRVAGCILAAYSEREIEGRIERFCNVGTWYVEPEFRSHSLPLSWKLNAQKGYTFTALTPNATSEALSRRAGYRTLSTEYHMYLPGQGAGKSRRFGGRLAGGAAAIESELNAADRRILRDHQPFDCHHFLLTARNEDRYVYVVTRRWKFWRRNMVPVTEILYVSDRTMAARYFERLKLGILLRDRSLVLATERRFFGEDAPVGKIVPRLRFFRSEKLEAPDIDHLYSEAVLL